MPDTEENGTLEGWAGEGRVSRRSAWEAAQPQQVAGRNGSALDTEHHLFRLPWTSPPALPLG